MKHRFLVILLSLVSSLGVNAQRWDVQFVTPEIVRVQWSADNELHDNNTGACIYTPKNVETKKTVTSDSETVVSGSLKVVVDRKSGIVTFSDLASGDILLTAKPRCGGPVYQERIEYDEASAHTVETANGKVTVRDILRRDTTCTSTRYITEFCSPGEKALYGLGSQMEDYLNLQGKTIWLTQHNLKVHIPVLVSTNGYGLLFDSGCAMKYSSTQNHGNSDYTYSMQLEASKELDFYFIYGGSLPVGKGEGKGSMEKVVAGYRYLTGNVSLMPRYVFGYTQSKERYVSSADLINTLKEYRRRHVPIDMIVQDWNYWPQGWGYMKMDERFYPDPKALADSIHAMNAKLMVSIWPNPQWCPEADDFKALGMMLPNDVYDVFNPEARKHYWSYANNEFFSRGFDAWWCDSSEPFDGDWNRIPATDLDGNPYGWNSHEYRWQLNKDILSASLGIERSSLYSLYHSMGIYENQRLQNSDKRVVNLTRSSYAGQQRFGTIVWNGDTHASWESFRQQIPSGLNYMATGNPYWTVDVGSFFTRNDGRRWFYTGEFPNGVKDDAYKEYYLRMFQWATFLPMLRSHGSDTPREIWQFITDEEKSSNCKLSDCKYAGAILKMINLRYAHIPYIYSMAAQQSFGGYTMARPLAFDYSDDNVLDLKDEYMFGNYLVCPVTYPGISSRKVYLPEGAEWIDYWTNKEYEGGQWIDAKVSIDKLPLFVKKGSIIPTTEVAEYTDAQIGKPITINIYPGKDGEFTIYEDEGDNYNYENGAFSTINLKWNDRKNRLVIGEREGSFEGMLAERTFIIKTPTKNKTITYKGKKKTVTL